MKKFHPDSLDMEILQIMESDCTKSYREISEQLGKDIWTVRDRVTLLKKRKIIRKCCATINYPDLGLNCRALMMFNVPAEYIDPFVASVKSNPDIKRLIVATGERRFILEMVGKDCNEVREFARKNFSRYQVSDVAFEIVLDLVI